MSIEIALKGQVTISAIKTDKDQLVADCPRHPLLKLLLKHFDIGFCQYARGPSWREIKVGLIK